MSRRAAALLALGLGLGLASCGEGPHVGRYTRRSNPAETLELLRDGTFVLAGESGRFAGAYAVEGDRVALAGVTAPVGHATLRGTVLVSQNGEAWARNWPAGHYAHRARPEFLCDLRPDGSYHYAKGTTDHRGRYDVDQSVVTLWYPSDGRCTQGGAGPAIPSPGLCAFLADVNGDSLTFFKLAGEAGQQAREMGEAFVLQPVR